MSDAEASDLVYAVLYRKEELSPEAVTALCKYVEAIQIARDTETHECQSCGVVNQQCECERLRQEAA